MTRATFTKELVVLWAAPVPWVAGALLHLVWGALYVSELEVRRQALFQPAVPLVAFLLIILLPVVAMRTLAEEARAGTLDLLLTSPSRSLALTVGKWLATATSGVLLVAPMAAALVVIERWGDLDPGGVLAATLGLLLLIGLLAAAGVAASSLTASQPLAGAVALLVGLGLWFAASAPGVGRPGSAVARLSISERLSTFAAGGIDSGDVVWFVTLSALCLAGAAMRVGLRRVPRPAGRTVVGGAGLVAVALALLLGAGGAVALGDGNRRLIDLTTGDALTLSDTTRRVLGQVDGPVEVTAFMAREDPARVALSSLLVRYRRLQPRIAYTLADPTDAAAEVRRLGVDPVFGGIVMRRGERSEVAATPTEQDLTAALARLVRDEVPVVCVGEGHGEASITDATDTGLSMWADDLRAAGFEVRAVNLLGATAVPEGCRALVLAGPTGVLADPLQQAVAAWLDAGGRLLALTDPSVELDWSPLLGRYGISVDRGIVFELDADRSFPGDPTRPIVLQHLTASPIGRRLAPTFYPGAQALVLDEAVGDGVSVEPVARTSDTSYLERRPLEPQFDPAEDRRGPIVVVAAADRSRRQDDRVIRSRVVATSDADVATNAFVGEAGNAALLVRSVDWLTQDDDIVSVTANLAPVRPLALTTGRLRYLRLLTMAVVPGLFLAVGALGWAARRLR